MGDDNVQDMRQLLHPVPCPACGSALALEDGGTLALAELLPCPAEEAGSSALDRAWAWFVASDAPLDD